MSSPRPPASGPAPPASDPIDRASFDAHRGAMNLTINRFFLEYLLRVRGAFAGDLEEAIVLGRVAHHNFLPWVVAAAGDPRRLHALLASGDGTLRPLPVNAHSIATATGIPRETVRRKLASLVAKGWLEARGRSEYFVTERPGEEFADFTFKLLQLFLETADELRFLAGAPGDTDPERRPEPE